MQYIVTQEPKRKFRQGFVVKIMVVEAKTKAGALAMSAREFEWDDEPYQRPRVEILRLDQCYRL